MDDSLVEPPYENNVSSETHTSVTIVYNLMLRNGSVYSPDEISIETKKSKRYPIRLNNSHKNKINGAFINEPLFDKPNVYSLIYLEGGSSENEITNTSSKITGNKARYAVHYEENSHNNFVGFNNFKGAYVTAMIYDLNSANNSMYNFPDQ